MEKSNVDLIRVHKGNYAVLTRDNVKDTMLHAIGLGKDIAFKVVVNELNEGILARGVQINDVPKIFDRYDFNKLTGKVFIYVMGGDSSEESFKYFKDLILKFEEIDNGRKILKIKSVVNDDIHPDFCLLSEEDFNVKT